MAPSTGHPCMAPRTRKMKREGGHGRVRDLIVDCGGYVAVFLAVSRSFLTGDQNSLIEACLINRLADSAERIEPLLATLALLKLAIRRRSLKTQHSASAVESSHRFIDLNFPHNINNLTIFVACIPEIALYP